MRYVLVKFYVSMCNRQRANPNVLLVCKSDGVYNVGDDDGEEGQKEEEDGGDDTDDDIENCWSEQEETVIANEIIKNHDALFGQMTGCGALKIEEVRRRGWEAVANVLNCQFSTYRRTGPEVKKKYFNMKDKKGILLEHFGDPASLTGVPNAIDTDAPEGTLFPSVIDLARASFNKLAEDNLKAEKKNIHLQQVNLRLKNQLILT
ncbi:hypothetical protein DPMN_039137 [Dreissena polymorpha]|uniref:Myb/SANT-like DNA-binding domain-containing protein n=1 Tax=Dreissena polymorpha TaxID=45954 RepID=A0A9D4ME18_DREPO|nr:hypothetical protein DPMN_039137 [Dreissena polymorpha]